MDAAEVKLFKIANGARRAAELPARLKIFHWGANPTIDGPITAGDQTARLLAANQARLGYERVAIDFDHCTVAGTPAHRALTAAGQPPLIFGYGRVNVVPGDGIWLEEITWTPLGVQHARNFEDLSPAVKEADGEIVLIHSVALTPNGKVHGLQFFSVPHFNPNPTMPIELTELAESLGLPATATKPEILARLQQRLAAVSAAPPVAALSARIESLELKLLAQTEAAEAAEREALVRRFAADGKVPKRATGESYSADELKALDVPTLRLLHANTPVTVPLSARTALNHADGVKPGHYRDDKGRVDLAALFEAEATAQA